jgi:hypothetical protein
MIPREKEGRCRCPKQKSKASVLRLGVFVEAQPREQTNPNMA